jgi:uncharacterized protein
MIRPHISLLTAALAALLLTACSATPPRPLRLHQLQTVPVTSTPAAADYSLGVGPLRWPDYLNRRQLLTRDSGGSLHMAEDDRWAEPLDVNFERVLRENLAARLQPRRLQAAPWALNDAPDISVPLEVLQFDIDHQHQAVLRVRWRILASGRPEPRERSRDYRVPARDASPAAAVAAQSDALARLAADIAADIQALKTTP